VSRAFVEGEAPSGGAIEIRVARARNALLLLVACAFVAAGVMIFIKGDPDGRLIAIACIAFFGACALVFAWQLFDRRPRLVFDDIGVFDRTLGVGRIPWEEIEDAAWVTLQGNHFICLALRDEAPWIAKLGPLQRKLVAANRALGFSGLNLNLSGLAVEPALALALVHAEIAKRAPESQGGDSSSSDAPLSDRGDTTPPAS